MDEIRKKKKVIESLIVKVQLQVEFSEFSKVKQESYVKLKEW